MNKRPMPVGMTYYTADEAAECLSYQRHMTLQESQNLYALLWRIAGEAENPTPIGGDGTDGTVECPGDRMSLANDDKAGHWWDKLTGDQQFALAVALEREQAR